MNLRLIGIITLAAILNFATTKADAIKYCGEDAKACMEYGAQVFAERCTLCHGSNGLGEGILPLSIKDYPSTNLLKQRYVKTTDDLTKVIKYGGMLKEISAEMPPWADELTATQLESVTMFTDYLINDLEKALPILASANEKLSPSKVAGRAIFQGRCSLCHGKYGEGDGKLAQIIKNPPPFNLTLSRMPDGYLQQIISKGGEKMGRSSRMPPFGGDLSENDIKSVILFIKTLRTTP